MILGLKPQQFWGKTLAFWVQNPCFGSKLQKSGEEILDNFGSETPAILGQNCSDFASKRQKFGGEILEVLGPSPNNFGDRPAAIWGQTLQFWVQTPAIQG